MQHPDGSTTFFTPDGKTLEAAPELPRWDGHSHCEARDGSLSTSVHPLDPVTGSLMAAGIIISARSIAVWDGTPFDVAWAMDVLR